MAMEPEAHIHLAQESRGLVKPASCRCQRARRAGREVWAAPPAPRPVTSGKSNKAGSGTAKLSAMAWIMVSVGFARPVSIRLMYVRKRPQRCARSSCVISAASRS